MSTEGKDPDILVPLTSARSEFEAETIAESLRNQGVPSEVFGMAARVGQWEFGINNDVKVMVRRADLERAGEMLRAIKADSVDLDWSEVDVGPPGEGVAQDADESRPPSRRVLDQRRLITAWIVVLGLLLLVVFVLPRFAPGLFQSLPWRRP